MRTSVTVEGNLADDPQVRFTAAGKQITEITVLVNQRRQTATASGSRSSRPGTWFGVQDPHRERRSVTGEGIGSSSTDRDH